MKTFLQLAQIRGFYCECDCGDAAQDRHHGLIPQLKKGGEILDDERNLVLVNHHEHADLKKFDNSEWRKKFWERNVRRYGYPSMMEWIAEVKATTKLHKSRFDFMGE